MITTKFLQFYLPIILVCSLFQNCAPVDKETQKRPNILFIITDDQSPFTLKAYGNKVCETPTLDDLSAKGMTLDAAHHMGSWSGAVCLPSRIMIQTAHHLWRIQNTKNIKIDPETYVHEPEKRLAELNPDDLAFNSIPAVFNRAGYSTFRTCKIGNTYEDANRLYTGRSDGVHTRTTREGGSQWHGEQVLDFLSERETSGDQRPFMIFYGFTHPHDPRYGGEELLAKYGAVNENPPETPNSNAPPLQINYLPAHPFHHGHPGLRDEERVQGVMTDRSETTIRNELGREYACIENIDRQIEKVLARLEKMGELDNTYVLFTADHGIAVGRHGLTGKQNLYEHTWRVPFLVMGPGIKAGSRAHGNTYLMDVLPTICDLAGIGIPDNIDGVSFKPVLMGEQETIRDVLYGAYSGGTKPGMRSVKKGDWKLIKYDVLNGQVRETQLFNLAENPHELLLQHHDSQVSTLNGNVPKASQANLALDPVYAEKRREMEALLLTEMKKWEDPYRLWDQPGNQ